MVTNRILSLLREESLETEGNILKSIAANIKKQRLLRDWTQEAMAKRTGIPLPTYRRFEREGETSLRNLVKLATVLEGTGELKKLFTKPYYASIEDVVNAGKSRKRGSINE